MPITRAAADDEVCRAVDRVLLASPRSSCAGVVFLDDVAEVPVGTPLLPPAHGSAPQVERPVRGPSETTQRQRGALQ